MKNFKFIISYDGSRYFGWERQPGRDTIQGKLEAVLTRMCGTDVQVTGRGPRLHEPLSPRRHLRAGGEARR